MIFPMKTPIINAAIDEEITKIIDSNMKILRISFFVHPKEHITEISLDWSKILADILELKLNKHRLMLNVMI